MRGGILDVFNTFSGGALERFSIVALGVMPYITASIVVQLAMSLTLLRREFARRLDFSSSTVPSVPPVTSEAVSA